MSLYSCLKYSPRRCNFFSFHNQRYLRLNLSLSFVFSSFFLRDRNRTTLNAANNNEIANNSYWQLKALFRRSFDHSGTKKYLLTRQMAYGLNNQMCHQQNEVLLNWFRCYKHSFSQIVFWVRTYPTFWNSCCSFVLLLIKNHIFSK